jgi:hypothetical protein
MKRILLAAVAALSLSTGSAFALGFSSSHSFSSAPPFSRDFGQTLHAPRGSIVTTGRVGQEQTTTLPGGIGQGLLIPNGNGTATLIGPNGATSAVPMTP